MVNSGGRRVFVERSGALEDVPGRTRKPDLTVAIQEHREACGDEISEHQPMLDARRRMDRAWPRCSSMFPSTVRH